MSDTHDDHVKEAQALLASRVAEMRAMLDASALESLDVNSPHAEIRSEARTRAIRAKALADEYGQDLDSPDVMEIVSNYGLAWEKYLTNHRDETVTYVHQLSTGGPGDEFHVTFGRAVNGFSVDVESVTYVYLPWFDRVEIDAYGGDAAANMRTPDDAETVSDFYSTFYSDLVSDDNVGE